MAQPTTKNKALPVLVTELWELVLAYVRQETLTPLKSLTRFVALGLLGSVLLSIGTVLVLLSALRALQTETGDAFDGNLSFLPYVFVLFGAVAVAVLASLAIGSEKRKGRR